MEIFAWNPAAGAESIDAFNARVAEVCRDEEAAVVDVEPSMAGEALVLSLTESSDLPVAMPLAILPVVALIPANRRLELEKALIEAREAIERRLSDEEQVIKVRILSDSDPQSVCFAVFIVGLAVLQG
jgi:hypothetical protein